MSFFAYCPCVCRVRIACRPVLIVSVEDRDRLGLATFGAFHDRHQIVGFGNVRGHGRMDVVGDSTAEPQVRRLLFGDGKHVHGSGALATGSSAWSTACSASSSTARLRVTSMPSRLVKVLASVWAVMTFGMFTEKRPTRMRRSMVRWPPRPSSRQIAAECADVGAGRAGHGHVEFHDWLHVRFVLPVGFGMQDSSGAISMASARGDPAHVVEA